MRKKPWILLTLLIITVLWLSEYADAETLYILEENHLFRQQGQEYFNAAARLEKVHQQGHARIQNSLVALRQSQTQNELRYWQMDYIQQRVWLLKAQAGVCIDLMHHQERVLAKSSAAAEARVAIAQSDFFRGLNVLLAMHRSLTEQAGEKSLEDDLLAITLLSIGNAGLHSETNRWEQKRDELINKLKAMRNELEYLSENLEKIHIHGGDYASSR